MFEPRHYSCVRLHRNWGENRLWRGSSVRQDLSRALLIVGTLVSTAAIVTYAQLSDIPRPDRVSRRRELVPFLAPRNVPRRGRAILAASPSAGVTSASGPFLVFARDEERAPEVFRAQFLGGRHVTNVNQRDPVNVVQPARREGTPPLHIHPLRLARGRGPEQTEQILYGNVRSKSVPRTRLLAASKCLGKRPPQPLRRHGPTAARRHDLHSQYEAEDASDPLLLVIEALPGRLTVGDDQLETNDGHGNVA